MRSNPVQVGGGFYKTIALGNNSTMAIDPYGTLTAWGENLYGQAGINSITTYSWTQLSNGDAHSMAIRSDNTLWAWGLNSSGQLGTNDTINRTSPTQISANIAGVVTSTWSAVSAGASHSVAIANDGVAYGWGLNTSGQVGDITVASRSRPVQIGIGGAPTNYSYQFSGSNYIFTPANAVFTLGTGDFTIEFWAYCTNVTTTNRIFGTVTANSDAGFYMDITSGILNYGSWATTAVLTAPQTAVLLNTWTHIAWVRISGVERLYFNGILIATVTRSINFSGTGGLYLGVAGSNYTNSPFNGFISNFRIIKGTGLYTAGFYPSTGALTTTSQGATAGQVSLLTAQSLTIVDNSTNAFTITNNGTVTSSVSNPFGPYYSGSFNGTNQRLTIADNISLQFGTSAFTIEGWFYFTSLSSINGLISKGAASFGTGSWSLTTNTSGKLYLAYDSSQLIFDTTLQINTWYHLALVRDGSNIVSAYINGVKETTTDTITTNFNIADSLNIGCGRNTSNFFGGYASNIRLIKGTVVYTGNFTVPTNILRTTQTAMTNIVALTGTETSLLTLQNATIVDNSTNLFTITNTGGVIVSSTIAPFTATTATVGTGYFIASKIAAGNNFSLAIKNSDNSLWSWGLNTSYQLGQGNTISRSSPVQIGSSSYSQVSAGNAHVIALDINNSMYTWGLNTSGQAGINTRPGWSMFTGSMAVQSVNAGIRTDGSLWAWGWGAAGALGTGDTIARSSPVQIGTGYRYVDIGAATYASLFAIKSDGSAIATGSNTNGYLGIGNTIDRSSPVQVSGGISWNIISGGTGGAVAGIDTSGRLYTWGSGGNGQLGDGFTTNNRSVPTQIAVDKTWSTVAMAGFFGLAITTAGTLWAWGSSTQGVLGDNTTVSKSSPVQIGTSSWSSVYVSASHVIAIRADSTLWGWGFNTSGQLGLGDVTARSSPTQIGTEYTWTSVSLDDGHSLFKRSDNTIWATGSNQAGRLGDGSTVANRSNPVQILAADENWNIFPKTALATSQAIRVSDGSLWVVGSDNNGVLGLNLPVTSYTSFIPQTSGPETNIISPTKIGSSSWSMVSAGYSHSLAITSDNKLFSWGNNTNGQLGIDGTFSFTSIAAGLSRVSIIRNDNSLWVWGLGTSGQLGDGTTTTKSSPVVMMTKNYWKTVTRGTLSDYAITVDNKLFAWGENSSGSIGDGTIISKSSPVQIGTSSWTMVVTGGSITAGQQTAYAIRSDGALFAWGNNLNGQMGSAGAQNSVNASPVQIGSSSWSVVSAGNQFAMAITTDGKLFGWGQNNTGQLGITPSAISWSQISTGALHSLAIRSDGRLFAWGYNSDGQLGNNSTIGNSSPIQIASGSYTQIAGSQNSSYAIKSDGSLWAWGDNTQGQLPLISQSRSSPVQVGAGTVYSIYFNSNLNQALSVPYSPPGGNFTLEAWVYITSFTANKSIAWFGSSDSSGRTQFYITTSGRVGIEIYVTGVVSTTTGTISLNTWAHIAFVRTGTTLVTYINGSPSASITLSGGVGAAGSIFIGNNSLLTNTGPNIYISNFRFVNGTAVYTGNFTVPTSALSRIQSSSTNIIALSGSETSILTCQNDTFIDNSVSTLVVKTFNTPKIDRLIVPFTQTTTFDSWSLVSANSAGYYALATRSDGKLFGWGQNLNSVIGSYSLQTPGFYNVLSPTQVSGGGSWIAISAGGQHALGIKSDNKLYAWGLGTTGQTALAGGVFSWVQIATGGAHTAAIRDDGALFMWGRNSDGQLGNSEQGINSVNKSSPVQIGASSWSQVSIGASHSLAIRADGTLWSWGINNVGQLGLNDFVSRSSPVQIGTATTWTKVIAGNNSSFAIRSDFSLYAWGVNTDGVLGDGTVATKNSPVQVITPVVSWSQVACGDNIAAGIDYLGRLYTWGYNLNGQLGGAGNGSTAGSILSRSSPSQVGADSWISIGVGYNVMTGIKTGGTMWSWGNNSNGEFGDGSTITALRSSPVQIGATNTWSTVTGGAQSALVGIFHAITTSNILWGWGDGSRVGDTTVVARSSMVLVSGGGTYIKALSGTHPLAITTTYALQVWGNNTAGEIGDGTINNRSAPLQIGTSTPTILSSPAIIGNSSWTSVSAGDSHSMAILSDGTLWAWGKNTDGQLGVGAVGGDTVNRSSPVQVGTSSWTKVSAGQNHTMALRLDSGLFTWGFNTQGQLGSGVATPRSSPVQVNAGTSYSQISSGASNSLAIDNTSKVYGWGYGPFGQLGDLTATTRSAPFQIGTSASTIEQSPIQVGSSSWSQISAGASHAVGVKLDSTVFSWGLNAQGQLGDATTISRSSPVQVGTVSSSLTNSSAYSVQLNGTSQYITTSAQTSSTYFGTGDFTIETWVNLTSTPNKVASGTYSLSFNGSSQSLTTSTVNSSQYVGTGDFTIECWVYLTSTPALNASIICGGTLSGSDWQISWSSTGFCFMPDGSVRKVNTSNIAAMSTNTWYHVAFTRVSGTLYSFLNGTIISAGVAETGNFTGTSGMIIGVNRGGTVYLPGFISNLRVIKGQAIYTGNFTPATSPLTTSTIGHTGAGVAGSLSGTVVLLTGQSDTIIDNSSSAFTFTNAGSVATSTTAPTTIYDYASIISVNNNWQWGWNDSGSFGFNFMPVTGKTTDVNTGVLSLNTWYHIAVQRRSNTVSAWVNGVNTGTNFTDTTNYTSTNAIYIGRNRHVSAIAYFPGYISNLRITKGQGLFTVGQIFTPSTTPLTNSTIGHTGTGAASSLTGTVVLLALQNQSAITDNSATGFTFTLTNSPTVGSLSTPFTNAVAGGAVFATQISAGYTHTAIIDTANKMFAWGLNSSGQLGLNDLVSRSAPIQIGLKLNWTSISAGSEHTIAQDATGTLWTWGLGTTGQLGDNTQATKSSPVIVTAIALTSVSSPTQIGTSSWTSICTGNNISAALSLSNNLFVWGLGTTGQLGLGLTFSRSSPVQISSNSYNLVNAGGTHLTTVPNYSPQLILSTGLNSSGQLGLSDTVSRSSPTQVAASNSSFNSPVTVSTGNYANYYINSPTQVGSSSWTQVSAGGTHTLGIKYDNTLWAWGYNANGQLADSTTINKSSPIQIGTSSWSQVSAGDLHNAIAKSDGTINTFGLNSYGQLGDGT